MRSMEQPQDQQDRFEQTVLPHLDAAYNLAKWLIRRSEDAEDAVQEACLRACRFFRGYRGGDSKSWLLRIVRNACMDRLRQNRSRDAEVPFDEELHDAPLPAHEPRETLIEKESDQLLRDALEALAPEFREVMVLREMENLSYKEIADIAGVPIGTVMSRLARGRERLRTLLQARMGKEL